MKKKIIVKISEGLGNQLFMYAHAYYLSKKMNRNLLIDDTSGFFQNKNKLRGQKYLLNRFKINLNYANEYDRFDTNYKRFIKKIYVYLDKFKKNKSFLSEFIIKKNEIKIATTHGILNDMNFSEKLFIEGNFENPNYFNFYQKNLVKKFQINENFLNDNSKIIDKLSNTNSVSIHVRQKRFSDQKFKKNVVLNDLKSSKFTDETLKYIAKSIIFFKKKLLNPSFFIWSNDFDNLESLFSNYTDEKLTFIKGNDDINDFHLFKFAKHFIVGPSTFHWWGAWINENSEKICLCPKNLNPSNNENFWPEDWIKV
jgi:hypothetical protein